MIFKNFQQTYSYWEDALDWNGAGIGVGREKVDRLVIYLYL